MQIRIAAREDAAGALAVYARYIDTPITFEYELPSVEEFARRIGDTLKTHPCLVAAEGETICGYAYAHPLRERPAYRWSAELSVYLAPEAASHGIGTRLYTTLIELLQRQGVQTVYGCVTTPNPASERLHEKLGFRRLGTFRNAGFKGGAWRDVTWFEKAIGTFDVPPAELTVALAAETPPIG